MANVTLSTQTQTVDLQPKRETPPPAASRFSFAEIKKSGVWAWEASVQSVKNAAGSLQSSIKRVASSVYEFFATRLQATKSFVVNIPENISLKLGARAYAPRIAALEAELAQARANQQAVQQPPLAANALPQIEEEPVMPVFPAHDAPVDSHDEELPPLLKTEEPALAVKLEPSKEAAEKKPMGWLSFSLFSNYTK